MMDQPLSKDIQNKKRIGETIQQIEQFFEQLKSPHTTNGSISFQSSLNHLGNICFDLAKGTYECPAAAIDTFEYILKNYIQLFDSNEFIRNISSHYASENRHLLYGLFKCSSRLHDADRFSFMSKAQQQNHCRLVDQFISSGRIISFLEHQFSSQSTDNDEIVQRTITNLCESVTMILLAHLERSIGNELDKCHNILLKPLLHFLDKYFTANKSSQYVTLVSEILNFLVALSHRTLTIPMFINANYPEVCLQWLTIPYRLTTEYLSILSLLCNIARHDNGAIVLHKHEYHKAVERFRIDISDLMVAFNLSYETHDRLVLTHSITLFLIYDMNEIKSSFANMFITNELLPTIIWLANLPQDYHWTFESSELWFILMKLCVHNHPLDQILQNKKHPEMFSVIAKQFLRCQKIIDNEKPHDNILELTILGNILWSISFHDQYKNQLLKNTETMKSLEKLHSNPILDKVILNIYKSHYMSSLRRAIDGLWYNLYPCKSQIKSFNIKSVYNVMISYSSIDIKFCQQIYDVLSKLPQLSTSVDFIKGKDLWNETAQTIEQSDLILFLISNDFFISRACRQEFIYATRTWKKIFILVYIDEEYRANDWLDCRLAGLDDVHFKPTDFETGCDHLLSIINRSLSIHISIQRSSNIKQWNSKDVQQWLTENNIAAEINDLYHFENGNELLSYAQNVLAFPWVKEYDRIKPRLDDKFQDTEKPNSSVEFSKFIGVLQNLINET